MSAAKFKVGDFVARHTNPTYSAKVVAVQFYEGEWHYQLRHYCLPASVSPDWIPERILQLASQHARAPWHRMGVY